MTKIYVNDLWLPVTCTNANNKNLESEVLLHLAYFVLNGMIKSICLFMPASIST